VHARINNLGQTYYYQPSNLQIKPNLLILKKSSQHAIPVSFMCKSLKSLKKTLFSYSTTKIHHSHCFDHQSKLEVIKACECSIRKTKRRKRRERERERELNASASAATTPRRAIFGLGDCWCAADQRGERESEAGCWWVFGAGLAAHSPLGGLRPWSKSEKPSHTVTSLQAMVLCRLGDGESGSL
jgi:hypothetical protein